MSRHFYISIDKNILIVGALDSYLFFAMGFGCVLMQIEQEKWKKKNSGFGSARDTPGTLIM
jgi:hypothetical protein